MASGALPNELPEMQLREARVRLDDALSMQKLILEENRLKDIEINAKTVELNKLIESNNEVISLLELELQTNRKNFEQQRNLYRSEIDLLVLKYQRSQIL